MSYSLEAIKQHVSTHDLGLISDLQFGIEARYNDEFAVSEIASYARRMSPSIDYSYVSAFFDRVYHDEAGSDFGYADGPIEVALYAYREMGVSLEALMDYYLTEQGEPAAFARALIEDDEMTPEELEDAAPAVYAELLDEGFIEAEELE